MLLRTDEDNDDVIESYSLYYIFSVFPSFVYYYVQDTVFLRSGQLWPIKHVPPHNWAGTFFWRHHGEGIGLPPSSSRFEHHFTGLKGIME